MQRFADRICWLALALIPLSASNAAELAERSAYRIPLVKIKIADDVSDSAFREVRIAIDGYEEFARITRFHDSHTKIERKGKTRTVYAEQPHMAHAISDFEARQINMVVNSLVKTLEIFERDLKKQRWDRCLYLDSFFPRFLKNYHYLCCAACNSPETLPALTNIPEQAFDVSLKSPKSDDRINVWKKNSEHSIKLRIIAKELMEQLQTWQKKELHQKKPKDFSPQLQKVGKTLELFVGVYFNCPRTGDKQRPYSW